MKKEIRVCDICGRVVETPYDIRVEVSPPNLMPEDELLELCPSCVYRLYLHLHRPLPKALQSLSEYGRPGRPAKYAFSKSALTPTEYQRAWRAANPEKARANQQRATAKRKAAMAATEREAEVV